MNVYAIVKDSTFGTTIEGIYRHQKDADHDAKDLSKYLSIGENVTVQEFEVIE